jgi:hypothetical protein
VSDNTGPSPLLAAYPLFDIGKLIDCHRHRGARMTETEWDQSEDPERMLRFMTEDSGFIGHAGIPMASERKLRLFCCACHRAFHPPGLFDDGYLEVEDVDGESDPWGGLLTPKALELAQSWCGRHRRPQVLSEKYTAADTADLLREIFGNPRRPVKLPRVPDGKIDATMGPGGPLAGMPLRQIAPGRYEQVRAVRCPWLSPDVLKVAHAAHQNTGKDGTMDPQCLRELSDALEESGCDSESLLTHLRQDRPHYRGCWAVDLILGKK